MLGPKTCWSPSQFFSLLFFSPSIFRVSKLVLALSHQYRNARPIKRMNALKKHRWKTTRKPLRWDWVTKPEFNARNIDLKRPILVRFDGTQEEFRTLPLLFCFFIYLLYYYYYFKFCCIFTACDENKLNVNFYCYFYCFLFWKQFDITKLIIPQKNGK